MASCEPAKAALALWRVDRASFEEIHDALFADPRAGLLLPRGKAPTADDPWIDEVLRTNVEDWVVFFSAWKRLPELLITGRRILHGLTSGEAESIRVLELELGL